MNFNTLTCIRIDVHKKNYIYYYGYDCSSPKIHNLYINIKIMNNSYNISNTKNYFTEFISTKNCSSVTIFILEGGQ